MSVTNTNSKQIANTAASPKVLNVPYQERATSEVMVAQLSAAAGDSNNSTYRFFRVRSGDRVENCKIATVLGSSTASVADIGLYDADGGAVVSQKFFADGLDLHTAAINPFADKMMTGSAPIVLPTNCDQRIWEQLGLTSDPDKVYDVTITMTTAVATAALKIAMQMGVVR